MPGRRMLGAAHTAPRRRRGRRGAPASSRPACGRRPWFLAHQQLQGRRRTRPAPLLIVIGGRADRLAPPRGPSLEQLRPLVARCPTSCRRPTATAGRSSSRSWSRSVNCAGPPSTAPRSTRPPERRSPIRWPGARAARLRRGRGRLAAPRPQRRRRRPRYAPSPTSPSSTGRLSPGRCAGSLRPAGAAGQQAGRRAQRPRRPDSSAPARRSAPAPARSCRARGW